jgi:two-component system, NtrC family, sensor kinase
MTQQLTEVQGRNLNSWLAVPLVVGGSAMGVLQLGNEEAGAFTADDLRLAHLIAAQSATAIHSARLFEETQHRLRQAEAMEEISKSITTTADLDRVLHMVVQLITKALPAALHTSLHMQDDQDGPFTVRASFARKGEALGASSDISLYPAALAAIEHKSVRRSSDEAHSVLACPLIVEEDVIGIIMVEAAYADAFDISDERLLDAFAIQASIAIHNASLLRSLSSAYANLSRQKEELQNKQNTLLALFDSITDGLYILDRELQLVAVNRQEAKRLGAEPETLLGRACDETLWQDAAEAITEIVKTTLATGEEGYWESQVHPAVSGPLARRDVRTYPIFDSSGEVDRVIVFAQDVSERQWLQASLFRSANLAAVGQLASSIGHEINNPLTVAIANSEILKLQSDPESPDYQIIDDILQSSIRISRIVRNLVDFSSQESYDWYETDVAQTIADALAFTAAPIHQHKIRMATHADDIPMIMGSVSHLKLLWMNLILNARDAIVAHAGKQKDFKGTIDILVSQPDQDHVEVKIIDNGEGIPVEQEQELFHPFFTTKPLGKGLGLGLHTCRTIVEAHHGAITLTNNPDGPGAVVCVTLPIDR